MHPSMFLLPPPVAPVPGDPHFGGDQVRCATLRLDDGVDDGSSRISSVRPPSLVVHRKDHPGRTGLARGQFSGVQQICNFP